MVDQHKYQAAVQWQKGKTEVLGEQPVSVSLSWFYLYGIPTNRGKPWLELWSYADTLDIENIIQKESNPVLVNKRTDWESFRQSLEEKINLKVTTKERRTTT